MSTYSKTGHQAVVGRGQAPAGNPDLSQALTRRNFLLASASGGLALAGLGWAETSQAAEVDKAPARSAAEDDAVCDIGSRRDSTTNAVIVKAIAVKPHAAITSMP